MARKVDAASDDPQFVVIYVLAWIAIVATVIALVFVVR
jgi:hypothetical protein